MDGAIVVVAGSEGQMPQTREHLLLSRQIGRYIFIPQNTKSCIVYYTYCMSSEPCNKYTDIMLSFALTLYLCIGITIFFHFIFSF